MIEINLLNIVGLSILVNMYTFWFTPIQGVKNKIGDWVIRSYPRLGPFFSCSKCVGLWLGLLSFHSLPAAACTSLLSYIVNHIIDRIDQWYE